MNNDNQSKTQVRRNDEDLMEEENGDSLEVQTDAFITEENQISVNLLQKCVENTHVTDFCTKDSEHSASDSLHDSNVCCLPGDEDEPAETRASSIETVGDSSTSVIECEIEKSKTVNEDVILDTGTDKEDVVSDSKVVKPLSLNRAVPLQVLLPEDVGPQEEDCGLAAAALPGPSVTASPSPQQSVYHIKWIKWKDHKTAIITQNENGPCPLIAIMNVLVLKGKVNLPPIIEMITADQLMEYLGDCILDNAPKNISEGAQLNYEQNMHDAMAVLPKLQTGLDVNVKFTGVNDFEYTPECIIFDLLNIPLYHGWLVDPQTPLVAESVGNSSYNQLVERIIRDKVSSDADVVVRALNAESFLERTASQLTYHGLCELNAAVQDDELCVMFRNNHFSTVYKHKNELFQLVTDQGFLTESSVVWETLSSIDGDGQFVDCNFANVPPRSATCAAASESITSVQQIDQDYLVALSLQEEQQRHVEQEMAWQEYKEKQLGIVETVTDEELARRLQLEEQAQQPQQDASAQRSQASAGASTSERHSEGKKKSDCTIL